MEAELKLSESDEINLKDFLAFLKRNYLFIFLCGVFGLIFSAGYLAYTPKLYESRMQLQMAQFKSNSNIEEPAALISRLRGITAYPIEVLASCAIPEGAEMRDYLDGRIKVEVIKNVADIVEMRIKATSQELSRYCAEKIISMIVNQQINMIEQHLAGRQIQLLKYQQAMKEEINQIEKIKNPALTNFAYLARLDKLSFLRTRIDELQEEAFIAYKHPAKLIAPIDVSKKPVFPKVGLVIMLGTLLGLMLGLMYTLVRTVWHKVTLG